jgi:beta-carotene hydroxylase
LNNVQTPRSILTPAAEKRAARELSPGIAWPTLVMAVALPATHWTVVGLGLARIVPLWACALALAPLSYAHYTLVHESIHGNLAPGHPRLRWLNSLVGWVGALGLGFNWPMMMRTHALHHAHTNTDDDPDIVVKGAFGQLLLKWLKNQVVLTLVPVFVFKYLAPTQYRRTATRLRGTEVLQASAVAVLVLLLLLLSVADGRTLDWLCLLFIPTRVAALMLAIFFQWLPHHPFDRSERYHNTRISLWPGGTILTLQQNLHLVHHLWPSVPFYNYRRLYERLHPTLIAHGSRIEGLLGGSWARDLSRS